jgi:hypothetical protein
VAAGTLSPTGSQIPSGTTFDPGEVLYLIDPETMDLLKPKPGCGWEFNERRVQIPDNISTDNRFLKLATNVYTPQPSHGMMIYGFKGVAS